MSSVCERYEVEAAAIPDVPAMVRQVRPDIFDQFDIGTELKPALTRSKGQRPELVVDIPARFTRIHTQTKLQYALVHSGIQATDLYRTVNPSTYGSGTTSQTKGVLVVRVPPSRGLPEYSPFTPDVQSYVWQNQDLLKVLTDARSVIMRFFDCRLIDVRLETDPEEGWQFMVASIHCSLDRPSALATLRQFKKEWYLHLDRSIKGRLTFDVARTEV